MYENMPRFLRMTKTNKNHPGTDSTGNYHQAAIFIIYEYGFCALQYFL